MQFCLSGSWDGTLRLWELATGTTTRRFVGHTKDVLSVAFSVDNRQVSLPLRASFVQSVEIYTSAAINYVPFASSFGAVFLRMRSVELSNEATASNAPRASSFLPASSASVMDASISYVSCSPSGTVPWLRDQFIHYASWPVCLNRTPSARVPLRIPPAALHGRPWGLALCDYIKTRIPNLLSFYSIQPKCAY